MRSRVTHCTAAAHIRAASVWLLCLLWLLAPTTADAAVPPDLHLASLIPDPPGRIIAVQHAGDGSGRLFIVEQSGRIFIWNGAALLSEPFLDIRPLVDATGGEQGLLGLAFDPEFAVNGRFYVNYTHDPGSGLDRTRVVRYGLLPGAPDLADPSSALVLLEIEQDFQNHNGGNLLFGPDGYLYIGMGDGGSGGDPLGRAQDLSVLLGKMLRIDVRGGASAPPGLICGLAANYTIPPDNPFAGNQNVCNEIWAYGLRNPWRWSFDRTRGDLFIGDVGQGSTEEIDLQPRSSDGGENYGWDCMEGNVSTGESCDGQPLTAPILTYPHTQGCSVTGGYRYRGPIAGLFGTYVYADFCSGTIWFANSSGGTWSSRVWSERNVSGNFSSFGEDQEGNLLILDLNGSVYRFQSASALACSGYDLLLQGETLTGQESMDCLATHSAQVADLQVQAGGRLRINAPEIRLSPGFTVQAGGGFAAGLDVDLAR